MMHEKRWTLEEHFADLEAKIKALHDMTEHHLEEARKSQVRERHVLNLYLTMVQDVIDALYWEIDEIRHDLDSREDVYHIKDQKRRNELWSEWVNKRLEMTKLERLERELLERLYPY